MKECGITPRALADDLFLFTEGKRHGPRIVEGMKLSRRFFEDIGAKVADRKCFLSSTCPSTRETLRHYDWDGQGLRLPVKNHFRDLGCHLCLDNTSSASTTSDRLRVAISSTHKVRRLPISKADKRMIILANILPAALYGIEMVKTNKALIDELGAAIAGAVGPRSARRARAGVFEARSEGKEIDPKVVQLTRRVSLLRRILAKFPEVAVKVRLIVKKYEIKFQANPDGSKVHDWEDHLKGPIGFLFGELKEIGAKLKDNLTIEQYKEQSIDIQRTPWQNLKGAINTFGKKTRTVKAAQERTLYRGLKEVDDVALKIVMKRRSEEEKNILTHYLSSAGWTNEELKELDISDSSVCELCGEPEVDMLHQVWRCKEVKCRRRKNGIGNIHLDDIPNYLKLGMPCAMARELDKTFWGKDKADLKTDNQVGTEACGVGYLPKDVGRWKDRNLIAESIYKDKGVDVKFSNARQAFNQVRGSPPTDKVARPTHCKEKAPKDINVYTDGSLLQGIRCDWALTAAAAWWPQRTGQDIDISPAEQELAWTSIDDGGLSCSTALAGFGGSSTRAEIAGGIIAIASNLPAHIGSDSQAFIDKGRYVLDLCRRGGKPKRPWSTQKDGDLWELFHEFASIKGPDAIQLTKVKGHASEANVHEGVVRSVDKKGNDIADRAAKKAQDFHGEDVVKLSGWFTLRHKAYTILLKNIHDYIIEGKAIAKQIIQENERKQKLLRAGATGKVKPPEILYKKTDEKRYIRAKEQGRHLIAMKQVEDEKGDEEGNRRRRWVQDFLRKIQLVKTQDEEHGTTWLELYALYKVLGYPCAKADPLEKAKARPSLRIHLSLFKKDTKRLAKQVMIDHDTELFKASRGKGHPLRRVGIRAYLPSIAAIVLMPDTVQTRVDRELLRLQGCKVKDLEAKLERRSTVPLEPFKGKNRVGWSRTVKKCSREEAEKFQKANLRRTVVFADEAKEGVAVKKAKTKAARGEKRLAFPDHFTETARRVRPPKRSRVTSLGITPGMLSTRLSERFGYLFPKGNKD